MDSQECPVRARHSGSCIYRQKFGGCRVIYLNQPAVARIDLVAIYGKDEQDTLTPTQRRELKLLAEALKREVTLEKERKRTK